MKFIQTLIFFSLAFPALVFAADENLIGPSVGSTEEAKPVAVMTSASIKPFSDGVPVMSQPYLLDEGEGQGYMNVDNVEIATTTKQCQPNFKPLASVSIVDTADSTVCAIKALHAYGAYVTEDKKNSGYKVFVSKANAEYSTCVGGSTGGVRLHWRVSCYNNTTTV